MSCPQRPPGIKFARATIALCVLMIMGVVLPLGMRVATGYLVRDVQIVVNSGLSVISSQPLMLSMGVLATLFLLSYTLGSLTSLASENLSSRLSLLLREKIMDATLSPSGIAHLENPETAKYISPATGLEGRTFAPAQMVSALHSMISTRLGGIASALLLLPYRAWVPFAVILSWSLIPTWIRRQSTRYLSGRPERQGGRKMELAH